MAKTKEELDKSFSNGEISWEELEAGLAKIKAAEGTAAASAPPMEAQPPVVNTPPSAPGQEALPAVWYVQGENGASIKPSSKEVLKSMVIGKELTRETYVRKEDTKDWIPAGMIRELEDIFEELPPSEEEIKAIKQIDNALRIFARNGGVKNDEIINLATKLHVNHKFIESRIRALGIKRLDNEIIQEDESSITPSVEEKIKPPPNPPSKLNISIDVISRINKLTWDKSTTSEINGYTVIRKKDSPPKDINDGEVLESRINACEYPDTKIEPAVYYFYAVFAERDGINSEPLVNNEPVINYFEISSVRITPGDSCIKLEWDSLPDNTSVTISRTGGADSKEHNIEPVKSLNFINDSDVKNDTQYVYTLKLVYDGIDPPHTTEGITTESVSPVKPPNPIEKLSLKPNDGDIFTAEWSNPDNVDVELYCSTEKPPFKKGDFVPLKTFKTRMKLLDLNEKSGTSASFQNKNNEPLYIAAIVTKSGYAMVGAVIHAIKREISIKNIVLENNKIKILIDNPKDATGFKVLYRFDNYPDSIDDTQSVKKSVSLEHFKQYNALVIDNSENRNYYFSVFAEFLTDGEKNYSIKADYYFSNTLKVEITYSVSALKPIFGLLIVKFKSKNRTFNLPDIDIMSGTGAAPVNKEGAKLLCSVPAQQVTGEKKIKIKLPKNLSRNTYIKAFLKDSNLDSNYKLLLISSCKIS